MPEGDTIWRTARTLRGVLVGKVVTGLSSPLPAVITRLRRLAVVGQTVDAVEAHGKHLVIRFSSGTTLHTHQMMSGSWHVYRLGSPWQKPARFARIVLEAGEVVAVCFSAPLVELLPPDVSPRGVKRLGPDLLAPNFEGGSACERLRARPQLEIGDALLDQTVLAGIGNVYKSEVLFLCRVNPFDRIGSLGEGTLARLVNTAVRHMRRNLGSDMRRTRSELARDRLWVYRRSGMPCFRCGEVILRRLQGERARSTYWCPGCQRAPEEPGG